MIDEVKNDVKFYECGEKMDIISAKVLSNVMLVIFQSDNVGNGRGFNLTYQVTGEIIAASRENLTEVSDQVRHKAGCTATEDGLRLMK